MVAVAGGGCADGPASSKRSGARARVPAAPRVDDVPRAAPMPIAPPPAEATLTADDAPTRGGAAVIRTILAVRDTVVETRYQGRRLIEPDKGIYAWDCSGMAAWILRESTPRARRALRAGRPLAKRFFHTIERAPLAKPRRGWRRLAHVSDARPGDVFAWLRSPASRSHVTGHVGFFADTPTPLEDYPHIYVARIVDSTRLPHGDDTRSRDGVGGFGFGTMLFLTDDTGETVAYGWHGLRSLEWGFMPARVIYGRVER